MQHILQPKKKEMMINRRKNDICNISCNPVNRKRDQTRKIYATYLANPKKEEILIYKALGKEKENDRNKDKEILKHKKQTEKSGISLKWACSSLMKGAENH